MNRAVLGATGRTGQRVVAEALRRGHRVVALCRRLPPEATFPSEVPLETADLMHSTLVSAALAGADAVICVLGPRPLHTEVFCAQVTRNLVEAMREWGLCRLVCLSGGMVGDYPAQRTVFMEWMAHQFRRQTPEGARDWAEQELAVMESQLGLTLVKPPGLTEGLAKGHYWAGEAVRVGLFSSLSRADLVTFLVEAAEPGNCPRQRVFIRN